MSLCLLIHLLHTSISPGPFRCPSGLRIDSSAPCGLMMAWHWLTRLPRTEVMWESLWKQTSHRTFWGCPHRCQASRWFPGNAALAGLSVFPNKLLRASSHTWAISDAKCQSAGELLRVPLAGDPHRVPVPSSGHSVNP